jgi:hypothetical protein
MSPHSESERVHTPDACARRSRRRGWWRRGILLTLLALVGFTGTIVGLARSEPEHWTVHRAFLQSHSKAQIAAMSRGVEARLLVLFDAPPTPQRAEAIAVGSVSTATEAEPAAAGLPGAAGGDDLRTVHFTIDEANAWLATNLDRWMTDRGYDKPAEITNPMIALQDGRLIAAFEYHRFNTSQIFSAGFAVQFLPNGKVSLSLEGVTAGRMPLPAQAIGRAIAPVGGDDAQTRRVARWIEKLQHVEFSPLLKLAPGKKVKVTDYQTTADGIDLTVRLERSGAPAAPVQRTAAVAE